MKRVAWSGSIENVTDSSSREQVTHQSKCSLGKRGIIRNGLNTWSEKANAYWIQYRLKASQRRRHLLNRNGLKRSHSMEQVSVWLIITIPPETVGSFDKLRPDFLIAMKHRLLRKRNKTGFSFISFLNFLWQNHDLLQLLYFLTVFSSFIRVLYEMQIIYSGKNKWTNACGLYHRWIPKLCAYGLFKNIKKDGRRKRRPGVAPLENTIRKWTSTAHRPFHQWPLSEPFFLYIYPGYQ